MELSSNSGLLSFKPKKSKRKQDVSNDSSKQKSKKISKPLKQPYQWQLSMAIAQTMENEVFEIEPNYVSSKVGCICIEPRFQDTDLRSPNMNLNCFRCVKVHLGGHLLVAIREHDFQLSLNSPEQFCFWLVSYQGYPERYSHTEDDNHEPLRWECSTLEGMHTFLHRRKIPRSEFAYPITSKDEEELNEKGLLEIFGTDWRHNTIYLWWKHRHHPTLCSSIERRQFETMPEPNRSLYEKRVDLVDKWMNIEGCTPKGPPALPKPEVLLDQNSSWIPLDEIVIFAHDSPYMNIKSPFAQRFHAIQEQQADASAKHFETPVWYNLIVLLLGKIQARPVELRWDLTKEEFRAFKKVNSDSTISESEIERLHDERILLCIMRNHYQMPRLFETTAPIVDKEAMYFVYDGPMSSSTLNCFWKIIRAISWCYQKDYFETKLETLFEEAWDALDHPLVKCTWKFRNQYHFNGNLTVVPCTNGDIRISFSDLLSKEKQQELQTWIHELQEINPKSILRMEDNRWILRSETGFTANQVREKLPVSDQ
jgi:hypothetical protein